jgi:membrane protease YdiL (CAAX protease family)
MDKTDFGSADPMKNETRHLMLFFLCTFLATWISYFLIILNGWDPYSMPGMVFLLLGGSAPSWVAILFVLFTYDRERRQDYFRRSFSFRQIKMPYWVFILLVFPLVFGLSIGTDRLLGGSMPGMTNLKAYIAQPWIIPMALFMSFLSGPWSEEFGWRGYSLDPLVKRFGIPGGSLLLGFLWGLWHLPLFLMPQTWHGQMGFKFAGFWNFMLFSLGLAMIMTWVYLKTGRSILSAFMMHLASNFTSNLFFPYSDRVEVLRMLVVLILGSLLCISMSRKAGQVFSVRRKVSAVPE